MKTNYLLPCPYKPIGWILFLLGLIAGVYYIFIDESPDLFNTTVFSVVRNSIILDSGKADIEWFQLIENNIFDEIIAAFLILGGVFIAFSRQKVEDEYISKIRLDSLLWATYINYTVMLFSILFIYDMSFFFVILLNMFTILFFFIARFYWQLHRIKKVLKDEK